MTTKQQTQPIQTAEQPAPPVYVKRSTSSARRFLAALETATDNHVVVTWRITPDEYFANKRMADRIQDELDQVPIAIDARTVAIELAQSQINTRVPPEIISELEAIGYYVDFNDLTIHPIDPDRQ